MSLSKVQITKIPQYLPLNASAVAFVSSVSSNQVTVVELDDQLFDVVECAVSMHRYSVGHKVLIQNVKHQIIVIQHLISADLCTTPIFEKSQDGWALKSAEPFQLTVGCCRFEVTPDGGVTLVGQDITAHASGTNRLLGRRIELN